MMEIPANFATIAASIQIVSAEGVETTLSSTVSVQTHKAEEMRAALAFAWAETIKQIPKLGGAEGK